MAHDDDLKQKALELYKSGKNKSFIAKTLKVSKPSVARWLQNFETPSKKNIPILKASEIPSPADWFLESIGYCSEIAESNRELRLTLTEILKQQLEDVDLNTKLISCLSSAIERHTELEWKARGLDFLEANRAIARITAMGYEINASSNKAITEIAVED